jgi:DNA-binding CsgD family transcriptional regulator
VPRSSDRSVRGDTTPRRPATRVPTGGDRHRWSERSLDTYYQIQVDALQRLTEAETARGRGTPGAPHLWRAAAEATGRASLRWDEAYCRWRQAQAEVRDRGARQATVDALRTAYRLAEDLAAAPLLAALRVLAAGMHVELAPEPIPAAPDARMPGLTSREEEILTQVVAGRTYAEIAKALVISEKTVSTHISNMLRKTGAANRVELAELARRLNA